MCFARGSCKIKYYTFKDQYSVFSGVLVDFLREAVRAARVILFADSTKVKYRPEWYRVNTLVV